VTLTEILDELPKLTPAELDEIFLLADKLRHEAARDTLHDGSSGQPEAKPLEGV